MFEQLSWKCWLLVYCLSSTLGPQSCQHNLLPEYWVCEEILELGFQTFEGHFNSVEKENGKKYGLILTIYLTCSHTVSFLIWLFVVSNLSTTWPSFLIHQKLFSNSCVHIQSPPAHIKTCLKTNMILLNKHTKIVVLFQKLFLFKKMLTILFQYRKNLLFYF